MQRVEDQVLAVVGPAVPGDHLGPAVRVEQFTLDI